jgi:hypothetical protein
MTPPSEVIRPPSKAAVIFFSDYPHTDGIWPESSKYIEEQF